MDDAQRMVLQFHEKFGSLINPSPTLITGKYAQTRVNLIYEEATELELATNCHDLVGIADALGDLLYVTYGAGVSHGIDLLPIFMEVHRSNMTKVWPDGQPRVREDGKILKPPTFTAPRIEEELIKQGWTPPEPPTPLSPDEVSRLWRPQRTQQTS